MADGLQPRSGVTPVAFRVAGAVDMRRLREAFEEVVRLHPSLRVRFERENGEYVQDVRTDVECEVETRLGDDDEFAAWFSREACAPFDNQECPRVRLAHWTYGDGRETLALFVDHLVCDGIGVGVLMKDLAEAYAGRRWTADEVQDSAETYREYCVGDDQLARDPELRNWWRDYLDGAPTVPPFPLRSEVPVESAGGTTGSLEIRLGEDAAAQMQALTRTLRVTRLAIVLAGVAAARKLHLAEDRPGIVIPVARRDSARLLRLVAWLADVVPCFIDVDDSDTLETLAPQAAHRIYDLLKHFTGAPQLAEAFSPSLYAPSLEPPWLFVMVAQASALEPLPFGERSLTRLRLEQSSESMPGAALIVSEDATRFRIEYEAERYTAATVDAFGASLRSVLEAMLLQPQAPLKSFAEAAERPSQNLRDPRF